MYKLSIAAPCNLCEHVLWNPKNVPTTKGFAYLTSINDSWICPAHLLIVNKFKTICDIL